MLVKMSKVVFVWSIIGLSALLYGCPKDNTNSGDVTPTPTDETTFNAKVEAVN